MVHAELVAHSNLWRRLCAPLSGRSDWKDKGHPRGNGDGPLTNLPTLQTTKGG